MPGAAPELKFTIVRAGAGAGKTRGLVNRVVETFRLFQKQQLSPRVVVTTFTRKATQELRERLTEHACREQDPALLQFVTDPNRLHISTIHGLLNVFLRQYGHLAGLDAGFQLVGGGESTAMARVALRESMLQLPDGLKWLETYGFNRTLAMCRAFETASREQGGLSPASLEDIYGAAQTQINAWKSELSEWAAVVLEEVDDPKWNVFGKELAGFAEHWSGDPEAEVPKKPVKSKSQMHLEDWHIRTDLVLKKFKEELKKPCWNPVRWELMAETWRQFAPLGEEFSRIFREQKEIGARFELADLELKAMEIIRSQPYVGALFSENWDYWMIDEYQDTSPLQVACLEALIGGKPTYYVGDPQQSIYLFRGAEVRVFEQAEQAIGNLQGEKILLQKNYRSEPDLLHWINDFMTSMSPQFKPMEARAEAVASERRCVLMLKAQDEDQELNAIVNRVLKLVEDGASLEKICVLGRTHRTLVKVSRALRARGFPTHVHASRGFNTRREVIDAQALWKFLINPHDNLNLLTLFRSPWFYVADRELREWMQDRPVSLWRKITSFDQPPEAIARLRRAMDRQLDVGLARTFEEALCSASYLDLSLVNDPAGRKESNLWKLIHKARAIEEEGGQSLLDFLDEESGGDPLDMTEGDAASAQEPNCINLMTIHGSKGLQFEHILVPGMGEAQNLSNTAEFSADSGKFFFPVFSDDDGDDAYRSPFVASPLDFLKTRDQREREMLEFDRWLYVAVTRAQSTLTLTWSNVEKDSWAARGLMFAQEPGVYAKTRYCYEILETSGEANEYVAEDSGKRQPRARWKAMPDHHEERKSVTELVEGKAYIGGTSDFLTRWQKQTLGTRIHRALEALKYEQPVDEESAKAVEFVLSLTKPPMAQLIRDGEVEWGFQVATPTRTVEGQIDIWGKVDGKIYVVDYKSGSPKGKEKAFRQLGLYGWALRKFGHREPMELVVIYPLSGKVESQEFREDLFAGWELEFGGTET